MAFVDRIVHRFIHRARRGEENRPHDEIGRDSGGHGHGAAGHGHGADHAPGEPGRFGGEHAVRYERRARSHVRFYRRIARDVAALAPDGGHVLDVGTGPGRLLIEIARVRTDVRVAGVDVEPAMVALAERAADEAGIASRVRAVVADVGTLPLEPASVDVVVASLTAHHWPDVAAGVQELARVLRPGGVLLVVDFRSAVDRPLRAAVTAAIPGATIRRTARWAWGLPALAAWEVRVPAAL